MTTTRYTYTNGRTAGAEAAARFVTESTPDAIRSEHAHRAAQRLPRGGNAAYARGYAEAYIETLAAAIA